MTSSNHFRKLIMFAALTQTLVGCGRDEITLIPNTLPDNSTMKILPDRSPSVYYGFMSKFNETADPNNYSQWDYTRKNLSGFYTNFIDMWQMQYQNPVDASVTCRNLSSAFSSKRAFFEATMEQKVNDEPNGVINIDTDKGMLDLLTNAGFNVDYASVNYMNVADEAACKQHIDNLKSYDGNRKVLYLCGPWGFNGDITSSNDAMTMAGWTDGIATDGPLGYWHVNQGNMQQCSYSVVKAVNDEKKESAIMLCPYSVEQEGYNPAKDFLTVSKNCVFGHEDNDAAPQIWTLWMYGGNEINNFPQFPESTIDENGEAVPNNTATGVAYWLLKHLNTLPATKVTSSDDNTITVEMTNEGNSHIELSPVVRAIEDSGTSDFKLSFFIGNQDVTREMVYNGGYNCVGASRISSDNPLTITIKAVPAKKTATGTLKLEIMSNFTNTINKTTLNVPLN